MAYGEKYWMHWDSPSGAEGAIRILEDNYVGGTEQLDLIRGTLEIRKGITSWEDPISRMNCSFTVLNDYSDWFGLLPLMTSEEGLYKVRVEVWLSGSAVQETLFEGFMDTKVANQEMLNYAPLQLTASGFLQKLTYVDIPEIATLQNMSLIDIIDACLTATGAAYNIRVVSDVYARYFTTGANQTFLNTTGVWTEVFWEDNIDHMNGLQILQTILKTFRCYLYWHDEYWYIEQYDNMCWTVESSFVEYTTGVSYVYADTGSSPGNISRNSYNVNSLSQVSGSQSLSVIPGMKEVEITLNQKIFANLFNTDLSGFSVVSAGVPEPELREWLAWEGLVTWTKAGEAYKNIGNSILRNGMEAPGGIPEYHRGLYSNFWITVGADTSLTISWKFGLNDPTNVDATFTDDPSRFDFRFYYYLRAPLSGGPPYDFLVYNELAGEWQVSSLSSESGALQYIDVNGDEFDKSLWTVEVSTIIPVGEISGFTGADKQLIVCIGQERIIEDEITDNGPLVYAYFGDITATISETPQNNVIHGDINSGFLNTLDIQLDLFDMDSFNYRNGLLSDTDFEDRTIDWGAGLDWFPIAKKLLQYVFRLYNVSRQSIQLTYHTTVHFWTFHRFIDTKQSNKTFVIGSETHRPDMDEHDVELLEWDGSTVINLI